jgi:CBS-domain-containing membrane protein
MVACRPAELGVCLVRSGSAIAIPAVAKLTEMTGTPLVLGSFGATCVLVFGYPGVQFSQPRNVVLGHVISSAIGLAFLTVRGPSWRAGCPPDFRRRIFEPDGT